MQMTDIPFTSTDWEKLEKIEHKGESGSAEVFACVWSSIWLGTKPIIGVKKGIFFCV